MTCLVLSAVAMANTCTYPAYPAFTRPVESTLPSPWPNHWMGAFGIGRPVVSRAVAESRSVWPIRTSACAGTTSMRVTGDCAVTAVACASMRAKPRYMPVPPMIDKVACKSVEDIREGRPGQMRPPPAEREDGGVSFGVSTRSCGAGRPPGRDPFLGPSFDVGIDSPDLLGAHGSLESRHAALRTPFGDHLHKLGLGVDRPTRRQ